MNTIILNKEMIHKGKLILVNAEYALHDSGFEKDLIEIDPKFPKILLQKEASGVLQKILSDISAGDSIVPISGYRSAAEQRSIFKNSLKDNGEAFTRQFVALENHSEHQTGLAIDLALNQPDIDFICPDFPYAGICDHFRKVAPDYGFIQRYAEDKETITGIAHEPWHFRYVGFPHSRIITDHHFALEEYIAFLKRYDLDHPLIYQSGDAKFKISFIPSQGEKTTVLIPNDRHYQISGNNVDGFILTVFES